MRNDEGFTLIELIITVMVIGILVAIAVPIFLNQKGRGVDAVAEANARSVLTAVETCYVSSNDYSLCQTPAQLSLDSSIRWGEAPGQSVVLWQPSGINGDLVASFATNGDTFYVLKTVPGQTVERLCQVPSGVYPTRGCHAGGSYAGYGTW